MVKIIVGHLYEATTNRCIIVDDAVSKCPIDTTQAPLVLLISTAPQVRIHHPRRHAVAILANHTTGPWEEL